MKQQTQTKSNSVNQQMTETKLIERLKNKEEKAFNELVNLYSQKVFSSCMGFVHNRENAEEITQDVFVEVFKSIDKFEGKSKLSTWIYRVAVNKSLNFVRDNKKNKIISSIENFFSSDEKKTKKVLDVSADPNAETKIIEDEQRNFMKKIMDNLPENQRTAFVLNKYDDLSYKEIAEIMNLTLSSVESLIHRAKVSLQKKLINK